LRARGNIYKLFRLHELTHVNKHRLQTIVGGQSEKANGLIVLITGRDNDSCEQTVLTFNAQEAPVCSHAVALCTRLNA
jgi:hypothetical protein